MMMMMMMMMMLMIPERDEGKTLLCRCVLVADCLNNTVVAVDSTLTKARVLPLPLDEPMNDPCRLFLDERAGKLFVAEGNGGRVLVFDNFRKLRTLF